MAVSKDKRRVLPGEISNREAKLPKLKVAILSADGVQIRTEEIDDPRILFCQVYNEMAVRYRAVPMEQPVKVALLSSKGKVTRVVKGGAT